MRPFAEVLRDWQLFYATFATACATLVGLLFVAVSLNRENLNREDGGARMWIARQTFYQFVMLFLLALLLLVPHRSPSGVGLALLGFGGAWSFGVARAFRASERIRRQPRSLQGFMRGFGLSFVSVLAVFAVAAAILLGQDGAWVWLAVVLLNLLLFTCRNAWFLLVHVRKSDTWQP